MLPTEIKIGYIFRYSYLWQWQHLEGREEGDKDRPCLVLAIVTAEEDGSPVVRVLPITHTAPGDPGYAVELPQPGKNRLGLDEDRSWIILTESNRFVWPGPDIRPTATDSGYYGAIPPALFGEVKRRFVELAKGRVHSSVPRTK